VLTVELSPRPLAEPPAAEPGAAPPPVDGHGLRAEVFRGNKFEGGAVATRIDSVVNWRWGTTASPVPGLGTNYYCARWTGWLRPRRAGKYRLIVFCDDGARLWLDGRLVIDEWRSSASGGNRGTADVELDTQPHSL